MQGREYNQTVGEPQRSFSEAEAVAVSAGTKDLLLPPSVIPSASFVIPSASFVIPSAARNLHTQSRRLRAFARLRMT